MTGRAGRTGMAAVLLVAGVVLCAWAGLRGTVAGWVAMAIAAAVIAVPQARAAVERLITRLRRPGRRPPYATAAAVWIVAVAYLAGLAVAHGRCLVPRAHDDQMVLLQTRMLSTGRLWMASHPLADFFRTFHVFNRPVYAAMHFPGTALLLLPWAWLGLPYAAMPLAITGALVAMTFLVAAELTDRLGGLLATLLLLSLTQLRYLSILNVTYNPAALLGTVAVFALLRWQTTRATRWLALLGAAGAWLVITRPPDAAIMGAPVAVGLLWALPRTARQWFALVLPAAPFLALQLIFNIGVTGRTTMTPHQYYTLTHYPQNAYGAEAALPPVEPELPQMAAFMQQYVQPATAHYQAEGPVRITLRERVPETLTSAYAQPIALALAPVALLGAWRGRRPARRWIVLGAVPVFFAVYALAPLFSASYVSPVMPSLVIAAVIGTRELGRVNRLAGTFVVVALALSAVACLPPIDPSLDERGFGADPFSEPEIVYDRLPADPNVRQPAIILFRWSPGVSVHEEPVYNIATAAIDAAPIIKAQDLGLDRDRELFRYYAARQPERRVYLFDRLTRSLASLGTAKALADATPATTTRYPPEPSAGR